MNRRRAKRLSSRIYSAIEMERIYEEKETLQQTVTAIRSKANALFDPVPRSSLGLQPESAVRIPWAQPPARKLPDLRFGERAPALFLPVLFRDLAWSKCLIARAEYSDSVCFQRSHDA
jgi:hypothetical protein